MRETKVKRISRLKGRKAELLGKVRELRASTVRNTQHKVEMLNKQVVRIGERIIKLKGVNSAKQN